MKDYDNNDEFLRKIQAGQAGDDGNEYVRLRQIKFTVSPLEFNKLIENFNKSPQKNLASFCREKALSKSGRTSNLTEVKKVFAENLYLFQKTSTNINQIARKVNTEKGSYGQLLADLQNELDEIKRVHIQLLKKVSRLD